ncbi:signal peptidase complex subunit 1-like [Clytia hemisphaerica]|uniref:Signal peptidase complex subunit 1 n=1 Tax=Clytia hemisphaerica TaxID=252671 RepID=A0A7M5X8S6_9CNID|eukprot:TCONS_00016256-protein
MDVVVNILRSIPFIRGPYDYIASIETHMDYEGQRKAEKIYQVILTVFGIVGFIWGFAIQQLSAAVYTVLAGFALSCLITLPPWSFFRRNPLEWMPDQSEVKEKSNKKTQSQESKKKK